MKTELKQENEEECEGKRLKLKQSCKGGKWDQNEDMRSWRKERMRSYKNGEYVGKEKKKIIEPCGKRTQWNRSRSNNIKERPDDKKEMWMLM